MLTSQQAHHTINIGIHVLVLFTFLTVFFFKFISVKEQEVINKELSSAIEENVPKVLDEIDKINKKTGNNLNLDKLHTVADNIQKKYSGKPDPALKKNNDKLWNISIAICIGLLVLIISGISYFVLYKKYDIGLKSILIDNLVIAILIGIVEAFFFLTVALKYAPINASEMFTQIMERISFHINKQFA